MRLTRTLNLQVYEKGLLLFFINVLVCSRSKYIKIEWTTYGTGI